MVLGYTDKECSCSCFLITSTIAEYLTKFSNHILLMDNVVFPGFYGLVSRLSNIDAAQAWPRHQSRLTLWLHYHLF